MLPTTIWFITSFALGALSVWYCRSYALKRDWLDHPNERSFHEMPTPRIGGIGMLFPLVLGFLLLLFWPGRLVHPALLATLGPALLVALLSFFDDRFDLSRLIRFGGHAVCAAIVLMVLRSAWMGQELPLLGSSLPPVLCGLLLLVWMTGLTNAYNFMDGIDGIAAIQGLVAVFGWVTVLQLDPAFLGLTDDSHRILLLILAGGLAGFLLLNWSPASIFMGDIGSTFLGFYLAALPFSAAALGLPLAKSLEAGVFFVWPFVVDASVTFARRLITREPVFDAHRSHLYQVLAGTFSTREEGHRLTSLLFGLLALVGVGLYWTSGPLWAKLAVLAGLWVAVTAWTYGIRVQSIVGQENSGSTAGSSGSEDSASDFTLPALMSFDIYLSPPELTGIEQQRIAEALASGYIAPVGPQLNAFEAGLADYLGFEETHAVSSGTAAIHLGLRGLGVGPGDHVLCPDLTFVASLNPIRYLGAEPVIVDIDPATWAIDPDLAREAIRALKSEGKTVRAMVVVHAFGVPAPMDALMAVANEEGVRVLEDCAGAFGATIGGKAVGSFGHAAAYSFNGNKVITTSGGGALYLKDPEMRRQARIWANQGKTPGAVEYDHTTLGYNYKLSNISAAIGLGQLETIDKRLASKKGVFDGYRNRFADLPRIGFMPEPAYGTGNYWLTAISVDSEGGAGQLVESLRANRIEATPMWKPMRLQPMNADLRFFGNGASESIHQSFLSLPSGSAMTREQLDRVAEVVRAQLLVAS
jgi:pyridoxal phosphate-dependent aminotransferase EpsN